jgi:hypothetical protein
MILVSDLAALNPFNILNFRFFQLTFYEPLLVKFLYIYLTYMQPNMKLLESFSLFNNFNHPKTMLNFSYWACNIIIFCELFTNFFFSANDYHCH